MRPFEERETISAPTSEIAPGAARRDRVVALRIHASGEEVELPIGPRIAVGAGPGCDVALADPFASHVHCVLERRVDRLYVRDQRSKNGTFLNGHRIELAEVTPGTLLTVGKTLFIALGARTRDKKSAFEALRGRDPVFRAAVSRAIRAASSTASVLVLGETGTGKELVARAVHDASPRAGGPFVALNCGAIPRELIEAELFGHERGAFTGADRPRDGVFVQADGGTLFLDELGELPRAQQPHLLRALETRMVRRVGGAAERAVDIRLVAATNHLDLGADGAALRVDLYHRVATIVVELPPLRERLADIPELVAGFLAELEAEFGRRTIAPDTLAALAVCPWPGNVRELRQAVHRATALSSAELRLEDLLPRSLTAVAARLPGGLAPGPVGGAGPRAPAASEHRPPSDAVPQLLRDSPSAGADTDWAPLAGREVDDPSSGWSRAQRAILAEALERYGTIRGAARSLGIPKSTFADRARRLGLRCS